MGVHTNSNCGCGGTGSGGGTTPEQPGNEFLQNNVGRKINAGIVTIAPVANNNLYDAAVAIKVAENLNTVVLTITEIQTPVIVDVIVFTQGSLGSKKHKLFFSKGKGKYGPGGTTLLPGDFELFYTQNLLIGDITDGNAYATFVDLGNLPDGDYLSAANSAERDFIDDGQTYFITYNKDGKAYLLKFNGEHGYYGGSYPDSFILENFLPASDSDVQPEITRTDQLQNTGANGTDKYATIPEVVLLDPPTANGQVIKKGGLKVLLSGIEALWAKISGNVEVTGNVSSGLAPTEPEHLTRKDWVNGLNISVNQATAELFLKNADGTNLATINLAFLNNEGTTFYFNDVTQNLELKNDDGEVLSVVPASSFVTGLIRYAGFNGATPHNLEFKDPSNNIVATVPVGMVNVQGLVAALNTKANADGSNAVPFSNWNINAASSFSTEMFGDAYGNFLNDGEAITHAVGYDSAGNRVRRYTASNFKLWLAIAMTDVIGLADALNAKQNNLSGSGVPYFDGNVITWKSGTVNQYLSMDGQVREIAGVVRNQIPMVGFNPSNTPITAASSILQLANSAQGQINESLTNRGNIPTAIDLNTYTATGIYMQRSNANAAAGLNYPIAEAGKLEVFAVTDFVFQTYHTYSTNYIYIRNQYQGTWSTWKVVGYDSDLVHKTGNLPESINGAKTFTDQLTQSTTQFDQTIDGTTGFTVKNKITASSLWSRGYRVANTSNATMVGFGAYGSGQTLNYGYISVTANNHDAAKLKFNSVGLGIGLLSTDTPTVALDVVGAAKFTGEVAVATATASGSAVTKAQLDALSSKYLGLNSNGGGLTQLGATADANTLNTMMGYGGSNVINFPTSGSILSMMFTDGNFGGQLHIAAASQAGNGGIRYRSRYSGVNSAWEQLAERSWVTSSLATAANNVAANYVPSSGASTIDGTKTFSEAPVVPAGTLASHAVNKGQLERTSFINKTANYSVVEADFGVNGELWIYVNSSAGTVNISLPALSVFSGRKITVIKTDTSANLVIVNGPPTIPISGYGNQILYQKDNYINLICNGSIITMTGRTMEFIDFRTTPLGAATLNTSYQNVPVNFNVICGDVSTGGVTYTKFTENGSSDKWLQTSSTIVPQ